MELNCRSFQGVHANQEAPAFGSTRAVPVQGGGLLVGIIGAFLAGLIQKLIDGRKNPQPQPPQAGGNQPQQSRPQPQARQERPERSNQAERPPAPEQRDQGRTMHDQPTQK
jgi:hypothetical protein